jgi:signal transduction histidine kinase
MSAMQEEKQHVPILIVDDDEALLQALPQVVQLRMQNMPVDKSSSAQQALEMIQQHDYDVIVSDVKMPGMDGLELLTRVHELRPDTPVVLITGHGDHDMAIKALRGGAYDYMLKPIDRDVFIAALQRALQTRTLRRKVLEQQLALELHAKSLERLVERRTNELVAANATKDKFLSIVSQEMNAPLENLKDLAQHLRHQLEKGEAEKADRTDNTPNTTAIVHRGLIDMERSIERTEVLVQDLLDISLIDSNMFVLHRQKCDLVDLCRSLLTTITAGAGPTLTCEFLGEPIEVDVDCDRIKQVLLNLLTNARKFSPRGKAITITLQQSGYEVILSIQDMGIGIPAEYLPHIFDQFYRVPGVEVPSGMRAGLGLGLYITRKIIERHGGHIEVQSMPGQGSIFSIVLPLHINPSDAVVAPVSLTQAIWTIT